MSVTGRAGLITSIFGLVIGTGIRIFLTAFLLQNTTIDQQYEQIDRYYREYSDDYDDDYYDDYNDFLDEFGDDYDDYFSPGTAGTVPRTLHRITEPLSDPAAC